MNFFRSVRAVTSATGDGPIDWQAVAEATKAATDPGDLTLADTEQAGYADDVRDARNRVREVSGIDFDVPRTVEIQHRHHWVDANITTFERVMAPLEDQQLSMIPGVARVVNTGTMAFALSFLANNVLGQYDPLLLAEESKEQIDHGLYFVHPNIVRVADMLDAPFPRFRRWIAFHEVAHAAEFGAAPWLSDHLEAQMREGIDDLSDGNINRQAFTELNTAMTAVEGYAELIMDHAFDGEYEDLRRKLDERRKGGGPVAQLVRRMLGMGMKRRQYELGKEFFEMVAAVRDIETAALVWEQPENLPTKDELENPARWIARVA
ncbi:zinc-dependent metalloprotease [Haladaptatus sp. ZSTT2]|uniref:zinc-dependent metalloprotease n=1 Tax=Haladaptatus sp. ZSTT2 TaxID=3120515 RepID=UPI00300F4203